MTGFIHALYALLAFGLVAAAIELWYERNKPNR